MTYYFGFHTIPIVCHAGNVSLATALGNSSCILCRQMELVPPPERVTLPAGVDLVQCFVCTAMFYTQEDHDKHIKLHRKADILRAISEHRHVLRSGVARGRRGGAG